MVGVPHDWLMGVTSDGAKVAETDLGDAAPDDLATEARTRGAELLWVHTNVDLTPFGFRRFPGYARLRAESPADGEPVAALADAHYAQMMDVAYRGLWGHKQVTPAASPPDGATVIGLVQDDKPVGVCTIFVSERLVDGPGLIAGARVASNYTRLLSGACAVLGPGAIDLDSWGDPDEVLDSYGLLGFALVERSQGWEMRLNEFHQSPRH
jgi:hypothetical protein